MTFLRPMLKLPSIALVAVLGGLVTAGEASACDMTEGGCAAAARCGCCAAPDRTEPGHRAPAPSARRVGAPRDVTTCTTAPTGGCVCGTERPAAPGPRPSQRPPDHRTAPARDLAPDPSGLLLAPGALARSSPPTARPPQRAPLYLRTSRLLI